MTRSSGPDEGSTDVDITVVMITKDRAEEAQRAVQRLLALPERVPIIVVDNGSTQHRVGVLEQLDQRVRVIRLGRNAGAAGRNIGVRHATTRLVAFADDDSAWLPGSLGRAARLFEQHPRLGLIAGRILVGDDLVLDPVCVEMAASPLPDDASLPGRPVLGFVACATVVRRDAFRGSGGFDERYGVGGEERPVAVALAAAGWALAYVPACVARHWPSPARDHSARRRTLARNDLWSCWRHRRWRTVLRATVGMVRAARRDRAVRAGLVDAVRGARPMLRERCRVESWLEEQLLLID